MKKTIVSILFSIIFISASFADNIKFIAKTKRVVSVGDQFRLSFVLNTKGSGFKAPNLEDFNVLMGPSSSQSSNIQFINGQRSQSVSNTYTYVLEAKKAGKG